LQIYLFLFSGQINVLVICGQDFGRTSPEIKLISKEILAEPPLGNELVAENFFSRTSPWKWMDREEFFGKTSPGMDDSTRIFEQNLPNGNLRSGNKDRMLNERLGSGGRPVPSLGKLRKQPRFPQVGINKNSLCCYLLGAERDETLQGRWGGGEKGIEAW
jgi:hypothetical protein